MLKPLSEQRKAPLNQEGYRHSSSKDDEHSSSFGRMLRFWRQVLRISQAALSESLDTSSRHLSFLENGRSNPSRAMVNRLASVFELNERDKNTLLLSAGFTSPMADLDLSSPQHRNLMRMLKLVLEKQDPYPSVILDRCGNVKLFNRAFMALFRCYVDESLLQPPLNLYRLYFSDQGFCPFIQEWETIACHTLFILQQELLLTGDPLLKLLFNDLCRYPGVPNNWALRVKQERFNSCYPVHLKVNDDWQSNCVAVITAIDPVQGTRPNLMMHSYYPTDEMTKRHWQDAVTEEPLEHPLLPY